MFSIPSEWHEPARRLAPDQESAEAADAPKILELLRGEPAKIDALVVARVRPTRSAGASANDLSKFSRGPRRTITRTGCS